MNIKHLHLHVRDRTVSEQFYATWLQLGITRRGELITFMGDGAGFDLALMDDPAPGPMPTWFHFGTKVGSVHAVEDVYVRMQRAAIPIARPLYRDETHASFRCTDPDGYAIEIYWEDDPH